MATTTNSVWVSSRTFSRCCVSLVIAVRCGSGPAVSRMIGGGRRKARNEPWAASRAASDTMV